MNRRTTSIPKILDVRQLSQGAPGITPEWGAFMAQAATVCLRERGHRSGVALCVDGAAVFAFVLRFPRWNHQMRRAFGDEQEATEYGACGIAILAVKAMTGYTVVRRSWKGTGFDYWLGHDGDPLFQAKARLEVSGIRNGSDHDVSARTAQKLAQLDSTAIRLPGYVAVVEFGTPRARVATS